MILGADVGYSNLKLAAGLATATNPDIATHMPAGAGPVSALPESLGGGHMRDGIIVSVQDQPWVAGVEPYRLHGVTRDLHDDYTTSHSYRALMLAAMQFPKHETLSALVTGLPVKHFQDRDRRLTLGKRLRGQHNLGQGQRVTVQKTFILPQPIGAFIDATAHTNVDHELLSQGRVLIVDAGFFSFDWAVVEEMGLVSQVSGTSLQAMSRLLDRANEILVERYGDGLGVERLEAAVRAQRAHVTLFGKKIILAPILAQASVRSDSCEIWEGTQSQTAVQQTAARLTGLHPSQVRVHTTLLGCGFGRRSEVDLTIEAVKVSKAVKAPVKVIWTRGQDTQHDFYRPATYNRLRAALNARGEIEAWSHHIVGSSMMSRVFPNSVRNGLDPSSVEGAVDCGQVINPSIVKAQIESAIVFGLTAALYGDITLRDGAVQQTNFDRYRLLRMEEMPEVEVHIVPSSESPGGMGEPGTPPSAPAVANAVFAATGKRMRRLPIDLEKA